LFVKEVFGVTKSKKAGQITESWPVGYPLNKFVMECKDVVKYFENHNATKADLEARQDIA
jgi:hypothetical protein